MDKICALIRQTWYETAKKNLKDAERLRFYEMCLEYEFNGIMPDEDAPFAARLLFDMVRDDLDRDKAKAKAKAERARENGAKGGRPKLTPFNSEDQNPEKPNRFKENLNNTTLNTTQPNTTECDTSEDTHTFFGVCLNFFERGCSMPVEEAHRFWGYYESLGWKTKGGGEIIDRLALAKAWRLPDCSQVAVRKRMGYAELMHKADPIETELLSNFVSFVRDLRTKSVTITFTERCTSILLDSKYIDALKSWCPVDEDGQRFALNYHILQERLD